MTGPRQDAPVFSPADLRHMGQALALAERGRGTTWPNPVVGAVITRAGRVIATGYHERAGGPHGEKAALDALGGRAPGATLYVTLEPCCHTGRTGPCTEAVIAAGIRRVVVGCRDENPIVSGRGIARLRAAGIEVELGCREREARAQNRGFFRYIRDRRPHVTLKAAASLDGFIAPGGRRPPGTIHWLTGAVARSAAHELRARHDALLVGAGTIAADDPRLTVRLGQVSRAPWRVVLDGRLSISPQARLFRQRGARPPLVLAARAEDLPPRARAGFERRRRALAARAEVVSLPGKGGVISARRVLAALAERQVQTVMLEGGRGLYATFLAAGLVDEVALFFAPQLLGAGVSLAGLPGRMRPPLRLGQLEVKELAGDILVTAEVAHGGPDRR